MKLVFYKTAYIFILTILTFGQLRANNISNVKSDLYVEIHGNKFICKGSSVTLHAEVSGGTSPYTYNWSTGDNTQEITVSPDATTTYNVYVIDSAGKISNTAYVTVNVSDQVKLDLIINTDSICPGEQVSISSSITGGVPPYTITDKDGNVIGSYNIEYLETDTKFIYTVTDACNLSDIDSISVHTYNIPSIDFEADVTQGCEPLAVTFTETSSNSAYSYEWHFGNNNENNLSFSQTITHVFENYGVYDVGLTVTTDKGCITSVVKKKFIDVFRKPKAKFNTSQEYISIINPTIYFNNLSAYASSYIWSFGDGDSSNLAEPVHKYSQIKDYLIGLIAVTSEGCKDTVYSKILVDDKFTMYVPTAFSPDNDGINDVFMCKAHGVDNDNFNLKIYNRWGKIIWETNDINEAWDGTKMNTKRVVEAGVYIWLITTRSFSGVEYQRSGKVTLIK